MTPLLPRIRTMARFAEGLVRLDPRRDRILAAFPKSGSTWVRFLLCNLVSLRYWEGRPLDFPLLNRTMPELGVDRLHRPWPFHDLLPRVVKTHQPARPVLRRIPALLLVRDPRDVLVSFFHHDLAQGGPRNPGSTLSSFIRGERFGLPAWIRHTRSWLRAGARPIRYEALQEDPRAAFSTLLEALDARVEPELLARALERSTLEATRRAEERSGADSDTGFDPSYRFVRKGKAREGRETLTAEDRAWIEARLRASGVTLYG